MTAIEDPNLSPEGLQKAVSQGGIVVTSLNSVFNWARRSSLWFMTFGLACCAIEMMSSQTSKYDWERFGFAPRATPRQSDVMIVAGTVTHKMAPQVIRLFEQMAEPRYVIAMGACVIGGGPFKGAYSTLNGIDQILPVDVYVPGCPPRPEALISAMRLLQTKVDRESNFTAKA